MNEQQPQGPVAKMDARLTDTPPSKAIPGNVTDAYRRTYESGMGPAVLESQLRSLRVFDEIRNDGERHLHNHGVGLLESIGIIKRDGGKITNMAEIVSALLAVAQPPLTGAPQPLIQKED